MKLVQSHKVMLVLGFVSESVGGAVSPVRKQILSGKVGVGGDIDFSDVNHAGLVRKQMRAAGNTDSSDDEANNSVPQHAFGKIGADGAIDFSDIHEGSFVRKRMSAASLGVSEAEAESLVRTHKAAGTDDADGEGDSANVEEGNFARKEMGAAGKVDIFGSEAEKAAGGDNSDAEAVSPVRNHKTSKKIDAEGVSPFRPCPYNCSGRWDNWKSPNYCASPETGHPNASQETCEEKEGVWCPHQRQLLLNYTITAVNESNCPNGTYRMQTNYACEQAADRFGFHYMGASTFYQHPRGCAVDLDYKVTYNFVSQPSGQPSAVEKLICANFNTCATHECPEDMQHKLDTDNFPDPTNSKCCEQKAMGAECLQRSLCEAMIGDLRDDRDFMCDCVFNHKGLRNVTKCREWLVCMHNQRGAVQVWFKRLLEFSTEVPLSSSGTSLVQPSNSSNGLQDVCYDPSKLDVFSMDCGCAEELRLKCGSKIDDQDCLNKLACGSTRVCESWKAGRCPSEPSQSLSEGRLRLESRAGIGLAGGAFVERMENAVRSPLEKRSLTDARTNEGLMALDEAAVRKNGCSIR